MAHQEIMLSLYSCYTRCILEEFEPDGDTMYIDCGNSSETMGIIPEILFVLEMKSGRHGYMGG